jgi:carbamoyl-phosphate synthase small subunit
LLEPALLALEDGTVFEGRSIGASGQAVGEVVFNTALTGYQEILTDPSYHQQLVTLTYPHIGNVGVNDEDAEAGQVQAGGLIVRDCPPLHSSWRAEAALPAWLARQGVVTIADIDTRRLTRHLRSHGALRGCILAGEGGLKDAAIVAARAFPGLKGADLARVVSTREAHVWREGTWVGPSSAPRSPPARRLRVVAYDYGMKRNILRLLVDRGCEVTVLPAETPAAEALALGPHGVFLSNGPGDPEACGYAIEATRAFLAAGIPLFGICLGHQILGLACGGRTVKMRTGHHGANHPVLDLDTGRVHITSQNHGFAVDDDGLPDCLRVTHRSLFDRSVQGIHHTRLPAFGFQGHPEASPGPHDALGLFDHFITLMRGGARTQGVVASA